MARARLWGDVTVAAAVLALALLAFALRGCGTDEARTLTVTTPTETRVISLGEATTLSFAGRDGLTVTVEVADGAARVCAAACPDHVCINTGWLTRAGETAACVPAGIMLQIGGDREVDAVAE